MKRPACAMLKKPAAACARHLGEDDASMEEHDEEEEEEEAEGVVATQPEWLDDAKKRRAAYGRMEGALKASGDGDAQAAWKALDKLVTGRDTAKRQWLADWCVDPSFATSKCSCGVELSNIEQESSEEEDYTRSRLEMREGKAEANRLIDGGHLKESVDRYGRQTWKFSSSKKRRLKQKKEFVGIKTTMDLNAEQAKRVHDGLKACNVAASSANKKSSAPKPTKEKTEEEKEAKASMTKAKGIKGKLVATKMDAKKILAGLNACGHALAPKLSASVQKLQEKMHSMEDKVDAAFLKIITAAIVTKLQEEADRIFDSYKSEVKIAKAIV